MLGAQNSLYVRSGFVTIQKFHLKNYTPAWMQRPQTPLRAVVSLEFQECEE
jgi:hypothetical protein